MDNNQNFFKGIMLNELVALCGDTDVGKTHLLARYINDSLPEYIGPTLGVVIEQKTVTLREGKKLKAQIWDTPGQIMYRGMASSSFRKVQGALVVYDVTNKASFESVSRWIEDLLYQAESDVVIILVGNKIDLVENNKNARQVSIEEGKLLAAKQKVLFQELSAKSHIDVMKCFEKLLMGILESKHLEA